MIITGYFVNGKGRINWIDYTKKDTFEVVTQLVEKQGYTVDPIGDMEIISEKKADQIINTRKPLGKFLVMYDDGGITAIDNEDGESWCEDFKSIINAIAYLYEIEGEN